MRWRCQGCGRALQEGQCWNTYCRRYRTGDRLRFKAGSRVVVKRYPSATREVVQVYSDIDGGRRLDRPVAGFVSWNVQDLRSARRQRGGAK